MWYSARLSNGLGFLRQYYDRGDRGVKVNITLGPNSKCILFVWQDDSSGLHTLIYNLECKIFIRDQYFWKERRWSRIVKRDKLNRNAGSPKLWQIWANIVHEICLPLGWSGQAFTLQLHSVTRGGLSQKNHDLKQGSRGWPWSWQLAAEW